VHTKPLALSECPMPHCQCSAKRLPLSVIKITCFGPHGPDSICAAALVNGIPGTEGRGSSACGWSAKENPAPDCNFKLSFQRDWRWYRRL
jgi:hypothetical protein